MIRMRSLAAMLVLSLAGPNAAGQTPPPPTPNDTWLWLQFADGALAWNLDRGRWNTTGDTVEGERLVYYRTPQDIDGQLITWSHEMFRIVCPANTYQVTWGEELNGGLGQVFELKGGEPFPIREHGTDYHLKRIYCEGTTYTDVRETKGMLDLTGAILQALPPLPVAQPPAGQKP